MCEDGPSRNSPDPEPTHLELDVIGENATIKCLKAILKDYMWRSISAPDVIKQIIGILGSASEFDDTQQDAARDQYIERMEETPLHRAHTIMRGGQDGDAAGPECPADPPGANRGG